MVDGYLKVIIPSIIWGSMGVFSRWSGIDPITLSFLRCLVAVFTLLLYFHCRKERFPFLGGKNLVLAILGGLFTGAGMVLYFTSINLIYLCYTLFIYYLGPIFVVFLSPLFFQEKLEAKSLLLLFISLCGVALIVISSPETGPLPTEYQGYLLAFLGAICFTFAIIIAKSLKFVSGLTLTLYQMIVICISLLWFIDYSVSLTEKNVLNILTLGIIHSAFSYGLYYEGLKEIKVQHTGILLYLDPVVASIFGYIFFYELLAPGTLLGGLLIILAGVLAATGQRSPA